MRRHIRSGGFTLIEVLVVVAIIALLISILLPSLNRARMQAKNVTCQSNVRQVLMGFLTYCTENRGRLPGMRGDYEADWLGGGNSRRDGQPGEGRQPEDGTIWRYMGNQKDAYICPEDRAKRPNSIVQKGGHPYSYTANLLMAGAAPEWVAGAHHPTSQFSSANHVGAHMKAFEGVPLVIEENEFYYLTEGAIDDSAWCNDDCITSRHLKTGTGSGSGNIGFADGHVARFKVSSPDGDVGSISGTGLYFTANSMCLRTTGGKWISGRSWDLPYQIGRGDSFYGLLGRCPSAYEEGVSHAGDP